MNLKALRALGASAYLALGVADLGILNFWIAPMVLGGAAAPEGGGRAERAARPRGGSPSMPVATAVAALVPVASDVVPRSPDEPASEGAAPSLSAVALLPEAAPASPLPSPPPPRRGAAAPASSPAMGSPVVLHFGSDSALVAGAAREALGAVVAALHADPSASVTVDAFTDEVGFREYNQELSARRAEAVASYLEREGIAPARIVARGHGSGRPRDQGSGDVARARNRRAEVRIEQARR